MQVAPARLVIAAAVIFWGWQTRMAGFAAAMAAIVIASAFARRRLAFGRREFARLWDLTMLLTIGAAIYNRQTLSISGAVITFLQWLPILMFPFTAAVLFSETGAVPRSMFLFWWRKKAAPDERSFDPSFTYFAVCLLAASAGGAGDRWFYPAAIVLIAAALGVQRRCHPRRMLSLALFLAVAGAGYYIQGRWRDFQAELEAKTVNWFSGFFPRQFEDQEAHTSLGEIGRLKSSGRVIMRVRGDRNVPVLYRQVSFDRYRRGSWLSTRRQYSPVPERASGTWELAASRDCTNTVLIVAATPEGRVLLPVPAGCARIRALPAARLEQNRFGNVRVWDCPEAIECTLEFNSSFAHEPPPQKNDLEVPLADDPEVARIVQQLGLPAGSATQVIERLDEFFTAQFKYTPFVAAAQEPATDASFVASFLATNRAGHCEYFATAAVLLLRKAGIPARYAMGYAAVEPGGTRDEFTVRERHAHSWVLAWVDGRWRDFDPTPARWHARELAQSSFFRPFTDWWADARFRLSSWQTLPGVDASIALYVLIPMGAIATWIVFRRRRHIRTHRHRGALARSYAWPGLDSEFYFVEELLGKSGIPRQAPETSCAWLERVGRRQPALAQLAPALKLHYRYRFDPLGLTAEERAQLAASVRAWMTEHQIATSARKCPATMSSPGD